MTDKSTALALETEPIGKLLFTYSLPAIAGMVIFSLYNIIDSIFIGHGVGALAISGLAVAFPIMNLTFAFGLLVGIGGASICSIRMGQKDLEGARLTLGNVTILNVITGVAFGALSLLFLDPTLRAFGAGPNTIGYARDFMRIMLFGLPVTYTLFNLNHVMRASGYPRKAMLSAVVTVGVNLILAPVFIFALQWGTAGAAAATVLSQCTGMLWVLAHFRNPQSFIHFQPGIYKLRPDIVKSIFSIGMSPFLMNICACVVVVFINIGLRDYGGDLAIGAYGIINRVLIMFVMIVMGLTQGMQPIVGYNYGAQQIRRVRQTLKYGIIAGAAITTAGLAASECFPEFIAAMFTDDKTLTELAVNGLRLSAPAFTLVGCQIVITNFFQSIGRAKLSIFLSLTRQLLFLIPALFILPRFLGLNGIWLSIPVSDVLAFITCILVFILFLKEARQRHPNV